MSPKYSPRSTCPNVFCKKGILKNFPYFTRLQLCWSLFLINFITKRLRYGCFPVNFAKILRTSFCLHKTFCGTTKKSENKNLS